MIADNNSRLTLNRIVGLSSVNKKTYLTVKKDNEKELRKKLAPQPRSRKNG